jgi:hypothetical protein
MRGFAIGVFVVSLLVTVSSVSASPIGLTTGYPDVNASSSIQTTYTAGTDTFHVTGFLTQFSQSSSSSHTASGNYNLTATINDSGQLVSGTLLITGSVHDLGLSSPSDPGLLKVSLTEFGFSGTQNSTVFEFVGNVIGGSLSSYYSDGHMGIVLNPGTGTTFTGSFAADFHGGSAGMGTTDNFGVPEPATLGLLLAGGITLLRRRRQGC